MRRSIENRCVRGRASVPALGAIFALLASASSPLNAADDGAAAIFHLKPTRAVSFTVSEGTRMNPDVSPDGRSIVFELLGDLYVVPVEGGVARAVSRGPAVDHHPRFSPDGRSIAYVSDRNGTDNLWVMSADGTGARMVSHQSPLERPKRTRFFMTPSWSPDGKAILAAVASELTFYGADDLRRYPLDTSLADESVTKPPPLNEATRPVYTAKRPAFPLEGVDPQLSADGRFLYYSLRTDLVRFNDEKLMPQYQVGQLDLASGQIHVLTAAPQGAFTPRLSPDGHLLVYATRHDADTGLRVRDLRSGSDRWLLFPVDRDGVENWWTETLANSSSFLPDGRSLVTSFGGKLQRVDIATGKASVIPFTAAVDARLAARIPARASLNADAPRYARHSSDHVLSPDGRHLAFESLGRIWIKRWPKGESRRLTRDSEAPDEEANPVWAPDGNSVIFAGFTARERTGHLYEAALAGRSSLRTLTTQPGYYLKPAISADGSTLFAWRAVVSTQALYAGFTAADLVRLPRQGGDTRTLMPVSFGIAPPDLMFAPAAPDRVLFVDGPSSTLVSVDSAGAAYRRHLRIAGLGLASVGVNSGMQIACALLHPDGRTLIVQHNATQFGQIDAIDLSGIDLAADAAGHLPSTPAGAALRQGTRRLTGLEGGLNPFLGPDGRAVYFTTGDSILLLVDGAVREVARAGVPVSPPTRKGLIVLRGARILTMNGRAGASGVIERGDVLVEGRRIRAVGPQGSVSIPAGASVVDVSGLTLMPGLISTHSHHFEAGPIKPLFATRWPLHSKLAYGVTTLLDPAPPLRLFTLADEIHSGISPGPRILQTGPIVRWNEAVSSPEDAARTASRGSAYADCCMKIYDVGGRLNRQWLFDAVARAGMTPIPESEGSLNASLSLVLDGVPHLPHGLAMPVYEDVRQLFARSGVSVSYQFNTLVGNGGPSTSFYFYNHELDESDAQLKRWVPYHYLQTNNRRRINVPDIEYVFRMYGEQLAKLIEAGVPVHVGEHGILHGLANHWAIWALANGAGNDRALHAATSLAAKGLAIDSQTGSIAAGKLADLIVIDGDPLTDIRATRRLRYVMKDGELYDPRTLARSLPVPQPGPAAWWGDERPALSEGVGSGGINPW